MIHSLRARLLLWLLVPLAIFVIGSGYASYLAAVDTANRVQDGALHASAEVIAGQINWSEGRLVAHVPPAALSLFDSPFGDRVFYSVMDDGGHALAGNPHFEPPLEGATNPVFYASSFQGVPVRVVQISRLMFDSGRSRKVTVTVGQTLNGNQELVRSLRIPALTREIVLLILAVLLVTAGLTVELRPLMRVSNEVAGRDAMDLQPVRANDLPRELRPIVEAINLCIQKLNEYVQRQKRFIADAAHQLRTPLAVLGTQLQYAAQLRDDSKLREILCSMEGSTQAMTDLANKLLLLSQAEAQAADGASASQTTADLVPVATHVLEDLVVLAQRRHIDLGADMAAGSVRVRLNEWMLSAVISNLVDNAIRYTPEHGQVTVTVSVEAAEGLATLSVSDNGPGIPPEARAKVFDRFYRNARADQPGSGLGLAIVKEIVTGAQGVVSLSPGIGGQGITLTVRLPLAR